MSISDVIIARNAHQYRSLRIHEELNDLLRIGCTPEASPNPIELCPRAVASYQPITYEYTPDEWCRCQIWVSPEQSINWLRFESVIKTTQTCSHRLAFEVHGNSADTRFSILCHKDDLWHVCLSIQAALPHCRATTLPEWTAPAYDYQLSREFFPQTSIDESLTSHEEFGVPPLSTIVSAMQSLPASAWACYQCVFQAADNSWREVIQSIRDLRYLSRLSQNAPLPSRQLLQSPLADLRVDSQNSYEKTHADRPLFFILPRLFVFSEQAQAVSSMALLSSFFAHFQHGGKILNHVDHTPPELCQRMKYGLTDRQGFLVNSRELAGMVHLLSAKELEERRVSIELVDPVAESTAIEAVGTLLGKCRQADLEIPIRIPPKVRERGTHIISSAGMGKSNLEVNMFLQDIQSGHGAAYIDPHGDAIHDILQCLPSEACERVIYLDPGDPDWIPLWNPLKVHTGTDPYRLADDLLSSLERVSKDWGDRLATILRNGLIGLMHLPQSSLLDLYNLTRQKSPQSDALRKSIIQHCPDPTVKNFWSHDFIKSYRESDLASAQHKLLKLVSGGSFSRMFAQDESRIDLRQCMDENKIILLNLSNLGSDAKSILGSFVITLLMMAAVSRSNIRREDRENFSIFADEAHLFINGDAFENFMAQARKFKVNLVIAHQYLKQFRSSQVDALSTAGSTIIGRVDRNDAQFLAKDLQGKIDAREISMLPPYQMAGRIGTEVTRFWTTPPPEQTNIDPNEIIRRSREQYCVRTTDLNRKVRTKTSVLQSGSSIDPKLLEYDEF